jgi:serine protease AprX
MHLPMIRRLFAPVAALLLAAAPGFAQRIDPELTRAFASMPAGRPAEVIVTFQGNSAPAVADLNALKAIGINGGITFKALPMAAVLATSQQVQALRGNSRVRSVFLNKRLTYYNYDARHLTGVERLRADRAITTRNGGLPVSGKGVAIVINDSGVDGTHPDLQLGKNLVQNVQAPVSGEDLAVTGFQLAPALENQVNTDLGSGHGTHVAGTVGGTGQASSGKHSGVADGANLIGFGSGGVLFILNALGGFDWTLANQARYGIRVITNSWGSSGGFDPDNPINVASRITHERNIVVTFAAGNSGSAPDTHNPYAKAPWVISVAAGTKTATLADFSSRGQPGGARTVTSESGEVITWHDEPAITAPGVDIHSAYAPTGALGALGPDTSNPFYTIMSGTSMATPVVAGIVGLMLQANPLLTPDQVKQILRETASKMPGYQAFEVGAGYVNAYAAVQKSFDLATPLRQDADSGDGAGDGARGRALRPHLRLLARLDAGCVQALLPGDSGREPAGGEDRVQGARGARVRHDGQPAPLRRVRPERQPLQRLRPVLRRERHHAAGDRGEQPDPGHLDGGSQGAHPQGERGGQLRGLP